MRVKAIGAIQRTLGETEKVIGCFVIHATFFTSDNIRGVSCLSCAPQLKESRHNQKLIVTESIRTSRNLIQRKRNKPRSFRFIGDILHGRAFDEFGNFIRKSVTANIMREFVKRGD
jgi:hypothetical protein